MAILRVFILQEGIRVAKQFKSMIFYLSVTIC